MPTSRSNTKEKKVKQAFKLIALIIFVGNFGLWAQQEPPSSVQKPPDNTKVNQRDRDQAEPTADQQKENKSDRELARQVRRALVKDKSLSTYAHNIKVIAQNGIVTLRGPVHSDQEKQAVEAKAAEAVGGAEKIKSEIDVSNKQASKKPPAAKTDNQ
jgi:hyperosmotically inducible periplasmic protein